MVQVAGEQKAQVPQVGTVRVTDATGLVLNSGQPTPVSVGDRDYFAQARAQPDKLIISDPLQGRIIKGWGIILARARLGADGSFQGVAYANLSTQHFVALFDDFNIGPQGAVSLRSPTLKLIARYAVGDKNPEAGLGNRRAVRRHPGGDGGQPRPGLPGQPHHDGRRGTAPTPTAACPATACWC